MKRLTSLLLTLMLLCILMPARAASNTEDYLGHWKAIRREQNGTEVVSDLLTYGMEGFSITDASALYFYNESHMAASGLVEAPTYITACSWTSQPDGSIHISGFGVNATLRLEGDELVTVPASASGSRTVYTRVSAADMPAFTPADPADCLGTWTLSEALVGSQHDVTSEVLAMGEMTLTLDASQATICNLDVPMDFNGSPLPPTTISCNWTLEPDGRVIVFGSDFMRAYFPDGNTLVTSDINGLTLRYTRQEAAETPSVIPTAGDYLGHWTLVKAEFYDTDVTEDLPDIGVRSYTIIPGAALHHALASSQAADGSWIYEPTDVSCTWSLQPDGSILVVGDEHSVTLRLEGEYLIGTDGPMTTWFARDDATSLTAEDYLGHWQVVRAERDGVDITADVLAYGGQGVTFNADGALLHGAEVTSTDSDVTVTRITTPAAWVFQPDGSMDVLQAGHPLTFRHDGEHLRMEDQDVVLIYARAEAPADTAATPFTSADCMGRWTLVKLTAEGEEIPAELLATVEFTVTFETDHAIVHMANLAGDDDAETPDAHTFTCAWHVSTSGIIVTDEANHLHMTFQRSGEFLIAESNGAQFVFARDDAPDSTGSVSAEQAAFLSVFAHPATRTDKELVMASAYASEKVYRPKDIAAYLVSLGFPEERIRHYDYASEAAHSVGLTLASREVVNAQGKTVTLYAIIVRGTVGTNEWLSNFDLGNGDLAMGFNQATLGVLEHHRSYLLEYPPISMDDSLVWVTGHSRGAAVANLIAGQYLSLPPEQVYCVTFATPNVAKSTTRTSNILNFVIDGDVVPSVPFTSWGFDRYGLTVHYTDSHLLDTALTPADDVKILVDFLSGVSQAEYYEMTLELFHSDAIRSRNDMELSDMLTLNIAAIAASYLDHGDKTLLTGAELIVTLLFNSRHQLEMQMILGELLPNEQRATIGILLEVKDKAGACHVMPTYLKWIECIYQGVPTTYDAATPGSGGGGSR